MANTINWGKVYCEMEANDGFGKNEQWSTYSINDISAPTCWGLVPVTPFTADMISYFGGILTADNAQFTSDITQL